MPHSPHWRVLCLNCLVRNLWCCEKELMREPLSYTHPFNVEPAGVHVPEEVQHHPPDLHHQEHPGDAHARGLHPCQPHLCCRGNSFRKDQYRYSIYYVMNMRKHRSSWNVHEPALNRKFVKIEKSLVKASTWMYFLFLLNPSHFPELGCVNLCSFLWIRLCISMDPALYCCN